MAERRRIGTPLDDPRLANVPAGRLIGIADIAVLLNVQRETVDLWSARDKDGRSQVSPMPSHVLPKEGDLQITPLWDRDEIIAWAQTTGRFERARLSRR